MLIRKSAQTILVALVALVASLTFSTDVQANDQDVFSTTVPATACQPLNSTYLSRVTLSNAAWVFRGSATGTVFFYCPLPINAFTKANSSWDNDISSFRVYYRDSDGQGSAARVRARLRFRQANGMYQVGPYWDSNAFNPTGNTTRTMSLNHDMRSNALYSFVVIMYRANTSQDPAFSGIDFPFPQIP